MPVRGVVSIAVPNSFGAIAQAVETVLDAIGPDHVGAGGRPDAQHWRLALTEALNNVVEHASGKEFSDPILIRAWRDADKVTVIIQDSGRPYLTDLLDYTAEPSEPKRDSAGEIILETLPEGGWGLSIIRQCVDRVSACVAGGRNILVLERATGPGRVVDGAAPGAASR